MVTTRPKVEYQACMQVRQSASIVEQRDADQAARRCGDGGGGSERRKSGSKRCRSHCTPTGAPPAPGNHSGLIGTPPETWMGSSRQSGDRAGQSTNRHPISMDRACHSTVTVTVTAQSQSEHSTVTVRAQHSHTNRHPISMDRACHSTVTAQSQHSHSQSTAQSHQSASDKHG